jgi:hypothetical protein
MTESHGVEPRPLRPCVSRLLSWAALSADKLMETALEEYFEVERHVAAKDGGEKPFFMCPECTVKAYVIYDEGNGCARCGTVLEHCWRCHASLTPKTVSSESNELCDYYGHMMSKDD